MLAPNGVEEERGPEWVEYAIYGAPGELPELGWVQAAAGDALIEVTTSAIPEDWADRWTDFHRPVEVAGRLRVRPSWELPAEGFLDLVIEPGRAFGTGAHATTRLCLELLIELADAGAAGGPIVDWGTGSGVLAIAAAKLGWAPVTGCDREAASLEAAAANAAENGVDLALEWADVREGAPPSAPAAVANLTAPLLLEVARRLDPGAAPRLLVCSGMLEREADEVAEAFASLGLGERERRIDGDWAALRLGAAGAS